jgi:small subunit ribosomal protein S19e
MIGRTTKDHVTLKDVPAEAFIRAFAEQLKKESKITPLSNDAFIKTGISKEVSPQEADWFYIRAAAIARKIALKPNSGVGRLRHIFGDSQRAGQGKNHHKAGSGKIIRYALQQLEKANILMKYNDKRNKNASKEVIANTDHSFARVITFEGQKIMNNIAKTVFANL